VEDDCFEDCCDEGARWMVGVHHDVAESSRMAGGDRTRCGVDSSVLRPPYIRPGCYEVVHREMPSVGNKVS
jgi:hypothetical protein